MAACSRTWGWPAGLAADGDEAPGDSVRAEPRGEDIDADAVAAEDGQVHAARALRFGKRL